jgi:hypothetical protein
VRCPTTATSVEEALRAERQHLQPLRRIGEPFNVIVTRRVSRDCLVSFEGRRYSVPFVWLGRDVEVLGTHSQALVRAAGHEIARPPRRTTAYWCSIRITTRESRRAVCLRRRLSAGGLDFSWPRFLLPRAAWSRICPASPKSPAQSVRTLSSLRHSHERGTCKVDLDATTERCTALAHAAECLPDLVEEASRENLSPLGFFHRVLEREIERKTERRVATSLKLSGMPTGKTLEGFDWTFQPRADRSKLEMLATCAFVRARENVLFLGPPGVGKSHLAVSLGVKGGQERLQRDAFRARRPHARAQGRCGGAAGPSEGRALSEHRAPDRGRGRLPTPRLPRGQPLLPPGRAPV